MYEGQGITGSGAFDSASMNSRVLTVPMCPPCIEEPQAVEQKKCLQKCLNLNASPATYLQESSRTTLGRCWRLLGPPSRVLGDGLNSSSIHRIVYQRWIRGAASIALGRRRKTAQRV